MSTIPNLLSIDFGTSRIKAAAWNPNYSTVDILPIGQDEKSYLPSLFHLDINGDITYGESAFDLMIHDPLGTLENVKLNLSRLHRAPNGQKKESTALLKLLFEQIIKKYVKQFSGYRSDSPMHLIFTLPARWDYQDIYLDAIKEAGVSPNQVSFIKEPVAAAFYWKWQEQPNFVGYLVVIDIGGGTVDWACVQATNQEIEIVSDCPPAGIEGAGLEVDRSILRWLEQNVLQMEDISVRQSILSYLREHKNLMFDYVRKVKERGDLLNENKLVFNIIGHKIIMEPGDLEKTLQEAEVKRITQTSCNYITKAYEVTKGPLTCILTGAGSQLISLKRHLLTSINNLKTNSGIEVEVSEVKNTNYTTALGAIYYYLHANKIKASAEVKILEDLERDLRTNSDHPLRKKFFDPDKISS